MLSKKICLIVEDADVVRKIMRNIVEAHGMQADEAATCALALAQCRAAMPDVIILDWHIPGSDTYEFLAAVRSLPRGRDVKILYVPTDNDPVEIGRAIAAGANSFMIKPFRRVHLEAKLAEFTSAGLEPVELVPADRPLVRAGALSTLRIG